MNNKPIIIDGVDVQYCEYYYPFKGENCIHPSLYVDCKKNSSCYYKQLQRAKKEIEFWKHNFEEMKKCFKNMDETATQAIQEKWQLTEDLTAMQQTYEACEKEYNALTKRYHELQGVLNANKKRI